jgi:hypothetical protein
MVHAPIAITYLGLGICLNNLTKDEAILCSLVR